MVNGIVASLLVALAASSQTDQAVQTPAPAIVLPPASETQETGVKEAPAPLKVPETMSLAGPRVGVTFLSDGVVDRLRGDYGEGIELGSFVSQFGNLNVPVNLAVVPSKSGVRVSLLAGFNARRGRK